MQFRPNISQPTRVTLNFWITPIAKDLVARGGIEVHKINHEQKKTDYFSLGDHVVTFKDDKGLFEKSFLVEPDEDVYIYYKNEDIAKDIKIRVSDVLIRSGDVFLESDSIIMKNDRFYKLTSE